MIYALSDPFPSIYVSPRDGSYYVGDRCSTRLIEAAVFLSKDVRYLPFDMDKAIWRATADRPGVPDFRIYAADQPGVSVLFDDGSHPDSIKVTVYTRHGKDYEDAIDVILSELEEGMVYSYAGPYSWEDYWDLRSSDFGC
ncbi:MAG: hypothetical protein FWD55_05475 [Propionibacteriaceae bacterium]|nr:hypothetical protein [Propionibacteriaceae bacterium]